MQYHIPRAPHTWTPPAVRFTQAWVSGPEEMSAEEYAEMEQRWLDQRALVNAPDVPDGAELRTCAGCGDSFTHLRQWNTAYCPTCWNSALIRGLEVPMT